jgi:hypothetical protein
MLFHDYGDKIVKFADPLWFIYIASYYPRFFRTTYMIRIIYPRAAGLQGVIA